MTLWSDANTVQRKAPQPPVGGLPTVVCALDLPWAFLTPVFQPKNPVHLSVYHSKNLLILFALTLVSLPWAPRAPTAQNSHGIPGPLFGINRLFLCPHGRNHQGSVRITSGSFTSFFACSCSFGMPCFSRSPQRWLSFGMLFLAYYSHFACTQPNNLTCLWAYDLMGWPWLRCSRAYSSQDLASGDRNHTSYVNIENLI